MCAERKRKREIARELQWHSYPNTHRHTHTHTKRLAWHNREKERKGETNYIDRCNCGGAESAIACMLSQTEFQSVVSFDERAHHTANSILCVFMWSVCVCACMCVGGVRGSNTVAMQSLAYILLLKMAVGHFFPKRNDLFEAFYLGRNRFGSW